MSETRSVGEFHGIQSGASIQVHFAIGATRKVEVSAQKEILPHLKAIVKDGVLRLSLEGNIDTEQPVVATITNPTLKSAEISGAGKLTAKGIKEDQLSVELSGAAQATIEADAKDATVDLTGAARLNWMGLSADKITCTLSGGSEATFGGSADKLTLEASGASRLRQADFKVVDADLEASGASEVALNASGHVKLSGSGGTRFDLSGNPTIDQELSGGSSLDKS